jgi:hypothetical protein
MMIQGGAAVGELAAEIVGGKSAHDAANHVAEKMLGSSASEVGSALGKLFQSVGYATFGARKDKVGEDSILFGSVFLFCVSLKKAKKMREAKHMLFLRYLYHYPFFNGRIPRSDADWNFIQVRLVSCYCDFFSYLLVDACQRRPEQA